MRDINKKSQSGMVLVIVMLLLTVLTVVVISSLQITLLETKMGTNFAMAATAASSAETKLAQYEAKLAQGGKVASAELISSVLCNVTLYRITAVGTEGSAESNLQSTYAIVGDISHCDPKPNVNPGRQSWRRTNVSI